jgi:hypothetical protein
MSNDFWINAFGTPEDGYKYQASFQAVNITGFSFLRLVDNGNDASFCLKGSHAAGDPLIELTTSTCHLNLTAVCRKQPTAVLNCSALSPTANIFDAMLNPAEKLKLDFAKEVFTNLAKSVILRIDLQASYKNIFSFLWYSSLPCFDLNGITSLVPGERSLLKACHWRGTKMPCAALFNIFPTDRGMCCSFNMKSAEQIFKTSAYSKLVAEKQLERNLYLFEDFNSLILEQDQKALPGVDFHCKDFHLKFVELLSENYEYNLGLDRNNSSKNTSTYCPD